jgi:hypothetical protein
MYIPPSQYKSGFYSNNNYNLSTTNEPYTGPYWVLTGGKPYTGNTPSVTSILLILPLDKRPNPPLPLGGNQISPDDTSTINVSSPQSKSISRLIPSPFIPTVINPQKNQITRYFAKKNTSYEYLEIDQDTYTKLTSHNQFIAWDLYEAISILWSIKGGSINTHNLNKKTVLDIENTPSGRNPKGKNWGGFSQIFTKGYLQFFQGIQENLNTSGGEYKTSDGKEYIGLYHIHPEKGPMVGANHVSTPHDYLFPINQNNLTPPTGSTTPITQTQPTQPTYIPPSTGGGISSGGGGGGY